MLSPICWGHSGGWNTCSPLSGLSRSGTSAAKHSIVCRGVAQHRKPARVHSATHGTCSLAPSTPPHQACSYTKHPDASALLYLLMTCCVGEIRNEDTWVLVVCVCVCFLGPSVFACGARAVHIHDQQSVRRNDSAV